MPGHQTIVCPDGYTYDVRDNSPYVQNYIRYSDSVRTAKYQACLQDPTCRQAMLDREYANEMHFFGGIGIFAILCLIFIVIALSNSR